MGEVGGVPGPDHILSGNARRHADQGGAGVAEPEHKVRLNRGKTFTKLDLAHAYQQVPLDEESKSLVAINTHKGAYRYHRFRNMHIMLFKLPKFYS